MAFSSPHAPQALLHAISWLETHDHGLMRRVNRWRPPRFLRLWMVAATRGGDGWLWYTMALMVALFGGAQRVRALFAAAAAAGLGVALFVAMKQKFRRKRPSGLEPHAWVALLPANQFSFPSGHTITAFAVAVTLGTFYPDMRPGLFFCAGSVAASRVLLGMHFLTDVLAGVAIGWGAGAASAFLFG
jgi:undecaprenyl-diphosphatase